MKPPVDRILIHFDNNNKWWVWEANSSIWYSDPTDSAKSFDDRESAALYAHELAVKNGLTEYNTGVLGIEYLSKDEIILSLKEQLDSPYCPQCNACGEDGCCSGSRCKKNTCLYGDSYALEYEYNKEMASRLYESFPDKEELEKIFTVVYDKFYGARK